MAQAKKTKAGTWTILVYSHTETIDGKEKRIYERFTADKKSEVVRMAEDFKANRKGKTTTLTVEKAMENYIEMKKDILSPATLCGYWSNYEHHFPLIRKIQINKLTNNDIQKEVNMQSTQYAASSLKTTYAFLSSVLKVFAPDFRLRLSYPQDDSEEISIPTEEAIKILLKNSNNAELSLAVKLALGLGLRRSEISALKISDFDFQKNIVEIKHSMVFTPDKKWVIKSPKTKSGRRTIPLPDFLIPDLKDAMKGKSQNSFLVSLNPSLISIKYGLLVKKTGIEHNTFHSLRHYYASMMLANNVPTKYAMKRMGHSSDDMLKRVYQHIMEDKDQEVTDTINKYFEHAFLQ